jgi:hypothetical protein
VKMGEASLEGIHPPTFVLTRLVDHASPVTYSNSMTGLHLISVVDMVFIVYMCFYSCVKER